MWKEPHEEERTVAMKVLQRYGKEEELVRPRRNGRRRSRTTREAREMRIPNLTAGSSPTSTTRRAEIHIRTPRLPTLYERRDG